MKLPSPLIGDIAFHGFMAQVYARMGCPHFSALHVEQANKLAKMKAKIYLLEQQKRNKQALQVWLELMKSLKF